MTLPVGAAQRFDARLSNAGLVAAMQGAGQPGLRVETVDTVPEASTAGAHQDEADLFVVHIPRAGYRAAILGRGARPLQALAEDGYALVVGSGFTSVYNPVVPLGLLQLDGAVVSELAPRGYTRIVGIRGGELTAAGLDGFHPGLFGAALQAGPGIVEAGRLDILRRERKRPPFVRAFLAVCEDRYLAGIAQTPAHLYDVGERLVAYFAVAGLVCEDVVNLSGDREALLAVVSQDQGSIAYFGNPALPKASVVAFRAVAAGADEAAAG